MFIIVEGRNHCKAEVEFVEEFKREVEGECGVEGLGFLEGSQAFLAYTRTKPVEVDFLFVSGISSLIDSRSSMSKENREACYWFVEHRKVETESIALSDIFAFDDIDARIRRLITHRIRVTGDKGDVRYRVLSLNVGRTEGGKLDERPILEAIEASNRSLTPEEIEQREKEFEKVFGEE